MKVKDYEYFKSDDFVQIDEDMQDKLISKMRKYIRKDNIPLNILLNISQNNIQLDFMYAWLYENNITISGTNGTLSGEIENYNYIKRLKSKNEITEEKKPLSKKETETYFQKIELGDINARNEFIKRNISLAKWYAHTKVSYKRQKELGYEDIEQIAILGMMYAVEKYNYRKGGAFSTYAISSMRWYILKELVNHKGYSVPANLVNDINKLERVEIELEKELANVPVEEIAKRMNVSIKKVEKLQKIRFRQNLLSIEQLQEDKTNEQNIINCLKDTDRVENIEGGIIVDGAYIDEQENNENYQVITTDDTIVDTELEVETHTINNKIEEALNTLTVRESSILKKRFGFDGEQRTLQSIGNEFGVTGDRIRQIEYKDLRKLIHPSRAKYIKGFLEDGTSYQYRYILEDNKTIEEKKHKQLEDEIYDLLEYRTRLKEDIEWIRARDIED